jgi:hypothetical protein
VPVAAAEAVGVKIILFRNEPLAPAVAISKMSVPTVPTPSDFVFAVVAGSQVLLARFGVNVYIGLVFTPIIYSLI